MKVKRNARSTRPKIRAFSAQVMTVRGDITVDNSPAANAVRVKFASATMRRTVSCCASDSFQGERASTMAASVSGDR